MALAAAEMGIEAGAARPFAIGVHPDPALQSGRDGAGQAGTQAHVFTGIGTPDGRNGAGAAQVAAPGGAKQAAFFVMAAAIVVPIEIGAFDPGRCFHVW